MSTEAWLIISIVLYSLSVTSISVRKLGYTKVADVLDILLTFGATAMMRAKELPPSKGGSGGEPPAAGGAGPTEPPAALPRAPGEVLGRYERRGLLMIGGLAMAGCGAGEKAQEVVQGASSGLVLTAPLIVEGYYAAQKLCLAEAHGDADAAKRCVDGVRERWAPVPKVYGGIRDVRCTFEPQRTECVPPAPGASVPALGAP